jgi:hypothetical protein
MAKKRSTPDLALPTPAGKPVAAGKLIADIRDLIEASRVGVARAVYSAQVLLHWQVGQRILADTLRHKRAGYGEEIVATVSRQLSADYGRGFAEKSLRRMIQFAQLFPDRRIAKSLFECSNESERLSEFSTQVIGSGSNRQILREPWD